MNAAVARAGRFAASPYARRLARDRALPLETLRGSGPGGRILAADVLGFVVAAAPAGAPGIVAPVAPAVAATRIVSFAASIALGPLKDLLAVLESSGHRFDVEDVLLRAAGQASAETLDASSQGAVALELGSGQIMFERVASLPMSSLRAQRLAALAQGRDDAASPARLSLRLLPASDIRPVTMPLLPGRAMRLAVCVALAGDCAECLLTADAASIDEAAAGAWLSGLKSAVEHPLRLFV
ncbi:E3 binding domain-containing protein [Mesorhizobium comanense]|uniref:E3 binding domain-containing protein n=1 Tax=Mesorhizobium comanense TaxID=2502215 RepID=UPI0010F9FFBA|nr:E3 binding domain-containing protein [Mesorhizobium comanense]